MRYTVSRRRMPSSALHRFAILLSACTLLLVVAGAAVVSKEAGLSVPDWPLSYGRIMPDMRGNVAYEHGHRLVAALVGALTLAQAVWISASDERGWMKALGWVALVAVVFQGVLGGLSVLYLLPKEISILHACLAQLFFALTVALAVFTSSSWHRGPRPVADEGSPSMRTLGWMAPAAVLIQLALGAAYRHRALSVSPHVFGSVLVGGILVYAGMAALQSYSMHETLSQAGKALIWVTGIQTTLGLVAFAARAMTAKSVEPDPWMVWLTAAHVAVGALTLGIAVAFWLQVRHHVQESLLVREAAA